MNEELSCEYDTMINYCSENCNVKEFFLSVTMRKVCRIITLAINSFSVYVIDYAAEFFLGGRYPNLGGGWFLEPD